MAKPAKSEKTKSTIFIKRIRKPATAGHGAAWKIAYADFMTALMAFFLLLWLLGSTTRGDQKAIADYFQTPLQLALWDGPGVGNSTTILTGGGDAVHAESGPRKRDERAERQREALQRTERERMEALRVRLDRIIDSAPSLLEYKRQLRVEITPEGLRIQIVDDQRRPMFDLGSARMHEYLRDILRQFAVILNGVDAKFAIAGHTDSRQYPTGARQYSNWELSIDRANSARRELIAGGMDTAKIARVVGLSDSNPLVKEEPLDPLNRRIAIIVLNKMAENRLRRAGGEIEAGTVSEGSEDPSNLAVTPIHVNAGSQETRESP